MIKREQTHIVRKQLIELRVADRELAHPMQDRVAALNKSVILPALAEACDQLSAPDQRLHIDKLEIDLGSLPPEDFEAVFKDRLVKQFRTKLEELRAKNSGITVPQAGQETRENRSRAPVTGTDVLCYFFEKGSLPWWYPAQGFSLRQTIEKVVTESPGELWERLLPFLKKRSVRLRLAGTLTDGQLVKLADPSGAYGLAQVLKARVQLSRQEAFFSQPGETVRLVFADHILLAFSHPGSSSIKKEKLKAALAGAVRYPVFKLPEGASRKSTLIRDSLSEEEVLAKLFAAAGLDGTRKKRDGLKSKEQKAAESGKKGRSREKEEVPAPEMLEKDDCIELNNAGLVLLWPYLEMFFRELGLVEDKAFRNEQSRWKAVQLLHFLVFAEEEAEEHRWALNKILCGMDVSEFVPAKFELNDREEHECLNLLEAVIRNWNALKNTSAQGLQEAFLRRYGLLKPEQNAHLVEIERNSIDVLLDRLSWPFSVIALPWNTKLIHVKW